MKVSSDPYLCDAHGQCNMVDPDLFPLDDEGYSALGEAGATVPPDAAEVAREGVDLCPKQALMLHES